MRKVLLLLCGLLLVGVVLGTVAIAESPDIQTLESKPLYEFSEAEVGAYIKHLQAAEPDLRKRIVHLARKNIGQPYDIYLLGEMPFETYDPQPIYCLTKSDCVVFTEHTYAMALTGDWPSFIKMLERIRYRDGQIGVATRNHYTEADWDKSNQLAGARRHDASWPATNRGAVRGANRPREVPQGPLRSHGRHPGRNASRSLICPMPQIDRARPHLKDGDFVNVGPRRGEAGRLAGRNRSAAACSSVTSAWWPTAPDGTLHMIHSSDAGRSARNRSTQYIARSTADLAAELTRPASRGWWASSFSGSKRIRSKTCESSTARPPRA